MFFGVLRIFTPLHATTNTAWTTANLYDALKTKLFARHYPVDFDGDVCVESVSDQSLRS